MEWVGQKVQQHGLASSANHVLEVGSLDVNGSVRPLFTGVASYLGVDALDGAGVDLVLDAHQLTSKFEKASFDVVVSTEMLEHDSEFWNSLAMMGEVLKPGGHLLLTARGNGFWIHNYPHDYFRFLPESFHSLLRLAGCNVLEVTEDWYPGHTGVFGLGKKQERIS
jgi:SAM-dependent methyltransferase